MSGFVSSLVCEWNVLSSLPPFFFARPEASRNHDRPAAVERQLIFRFARLHASDSAECRQERRRMFTSKWTEDCSVDVIQGNPIKSRGKGRSCTKITARIESTGEFDVRFVSTAKSSSEGHSLKRVHRRELTCRSKSGIAVRHWTRTSSRAAKATKFKPNISKLIELKASDE